MVTGVCVNLKAGLAIRSGNHNVRTALVDDEKFHVCEGEVMAPSQPPWPVSPEEFLLYVTRNRVPLVPVGSDKTVLEFLAISNALGGEVGELQNIVKKIVKDGVYFADHPLHDKLVLELGDALHYLFSLISHIGFNLSYVMARNIEKFEARKQEHEKTRSAVLPETASKP